MSAEGPRETNNPQLRWRRASDMRMTSECGRYVVDRQPNYAQYPAMTYEYVAKRMNFQANPLGTFKSFDLAAGACEWDLSSQPQPKGN